MASDQAIQFIQNLLRAMVSKNASDLFITAGFPPAMKIDQRGKRH
jgi:twitching motility protein PilU